MEFSTSAWIRFSGWLHHPSLIDRCESLRTRIFAADKPKYLSTSVKLGIVVDNSNQDSKTSETKDRPELPDHLSSDPRSALYIADVFQHQVGIRLNGKEITGVKEYCISGGWILVASSKTFDRKGKPLLMKLKGRIEAFYK